jgi:hypothetical protein
VKFWVYIGERTVNFWVATRDRRKETELEVADASTRSTHPTPKPTELVQEEV